MATKSAELRDKEFYHELTDKQQRVVDAVVENPGASDSELSRIADVSRPYVKTVQEKYDHVIENKMNERDEGEVTTEPISEDEIDELVESDNNEPDDDPFAEQYEQLHEQAQDKWQYISERPANAVKQTAEQAVAKSGHDELQTSTIEAAKADRSSAENASSEKSDSPDQEADSTDEVVEEPTDTREQRGLVLELDRDEVEVLLQNPETPEELRDRIVTGLLDVAF